MDYTLIQLLIHTEDRRFWAHPGIDPLSILRSILANAKSFKWKQGGSTLTQQLARRRYLSTDKTLTRKIQEMFWAFYLEIKLGKLGILEAYCKEIYMGSSCGSGFDNAAMHYFGMKVDKLALEQKAALVAMVKGPGIYKPGSKAGRIRTEWVLRSLRK